ncbi:hypothetical protein [Blastopirellula marina]|uniref:Uncharacterized protein n=1 Tax=Blastopirellula marina TaxID=124 RepID=A0A2S8FXE3_9BACT|nr:hypothetical protein [Blastopirellula marina]PQO36514.1 hypothetical protein C5Y98_12515 [Blastopirellula marina]PTL44353.1 hypothetical protein C5Y97_12525 [Blastopirellula marina]
MRFSLELSLAAGLVVAFAAAALGGEEQNEPDWDKLAAAVNSPGTPSIVDKPWVTVDCCAANHSIKVLGWITQESKGELHLLEWDGTLHRFRRPQEGEQRPELPPGKFGGIDGEDIETADRSVAWGVTPGDYLARSEERLARGHVKHDYSEMINSFVLERADHADFILDAARYAHYAHVLGKREHATAWYAAALESKKDYWRHVDDPDSEKSLIAFVADKRAAGFCYSAISAGHKGESRPKLLQRWRDLAAMPDQMFRDEAREMVALYQDLIAEDEKWREPNAAERAKFTKDQWVDYWLYHLRDFDAYSDWDPAGCRLFGVFRATPSKGPDGEYRNPADELKKLGKDALPKVIEHLDDRRPTRCKGQWKWYSAEGQYLLRYGDCCQQIFEAITEHKIYRSRTTTGQPTSDNVEKQCKSAADKWWREQQGLPPAE